jgi:outer membrane protein OmpA-like peptidoglycan-associated protein
MRKTTFFFLLLLPVIASAQQFTKAFVPGDTISRQGNGYLARNIQFQLDKTELIPGSTSALDSIANFLRKNDSLVIEIGVHGSTRNSLTRCNQLTQGRARSIADYLIEKGASPLHLSPKGYGQTHLLFTDAQIQKTQDMELRHLMNRRNRRVEFVILRGQNTLTDSGFTNKTEAKNKLVNGMKEGRWVEYFHHDVEYSGAATETDKATFYLLTFYKHGNPSGIQRKYDMGGMLMLETPYDESGKEIKH